MISGLFFVIVLVASNVEFAVPIKKVIIIFTSLAVVKLLLLLFIYLFIYLFIFSQN